MNVLISRVGVLVFYCAIIMLFSAKIVDCEERNPVGSDKTMLTFLKMGHPLEFSNLSPNVKQSYINAINSFPDYSDCVISSDKNSGSSAINFDRIGSLVELEVCLFWMSQQVKDLEILREIIANSGFDVDPYIQYPKSAMRRFSSDEAGILFGAHMSFERVPSSLLSVLDRIAPPHSLSIGILHTRDLLPVDITVVFNRL